MRIISGKLRNRSLRAASHMRPTSDRVRGTLFNILQNEIEDSIFVDAFAGSGAVGIEAISRGAAMVYFVEENQKSLKALGSNLKDCCTEGSWRIFAVPIIKGLELIRQSAAHVDLLFFDPPYNFSGYTKLLDQAGRLFPESLYVLESSARTKLEVPAAIQLKKERKIGESLLSFFRIA
jgi:16S rRNA (guanine966-N2)-methyltransferase